MLGAAVVITLSPSEFHDDVLNGAFDAVIDVRTPSEWSAGRIPNATFLDSLADFGTSNEKSTPDALGGCESCRLAVYCRSGARAGRAAARLIEVGFKGPIYNGGGVTGWVKEGHGLVTAGESVDPPCACGKCGEGQCREKGEEDNIGAVDDLSTDGNGSVGEGGVGDSDSNGDEEEDSSDEGGENDAVGDSADSTSTSGGKPAQKETGVRDNWPSSEEEDQLRPFDEGDAVEVYSRAFTWCPRGSALLRTAVASLSALALCFLA